ncbi:MAG: aromatic ring-hydroxylating dioxygenase subunit alpha [Betaproteobacteria bacterium]|nr:aromatic ring-hydroxylating dioxygenase subunit alpha [Betaproteobacteria bacterium]
MSDLTSASVLTNTSPALSVDWYFDPKIHELEMQLLFQQGPGYVGHALMVPGLGDYQVLDWLNGGGKMLVRNDGGVELLSNVCRHRQALMLKGRGNAQNIVCPFHRWTYDLGGQLKGAPHFPNNPCLHLNKSQLQSWHGLLFNGRRDVLKDLAGMATAANLDFSGFVYHSTMVTPYNFNWKTFIEVYLEDYHVVPYHPGLGNFVNCDDLKWEYGEWFSVQTVGVNNHLAKPGSATYGQWHEQVKRYYGDKAPAHGAIWLTYYPNIMVEWYPHTLVVSHIVPTGIESCLNVVEYYYPEDIALFEPEFVAAEQAAYRETAIEDDDICYGMHNGRRALYEQGISQAGPYQSPMEDGMVHFHEFLRQKIGPHR